MKFAIAMFVVLVGLSVNVTPNRVDADERIGWMQYRGPNGEGRYRGELALPSGLNLNSDLRWKANVDPGDSSPIVVGDLIVLTGYQTKKLTTAGFDRLTGALLWKVEIAVDDFEKTHRQHGPATPTPVSDGKRIYVVFGSLGVIALDLMGNEIWRNEWVFERNLFGSASSPILVEGNLIVFAGNQKESLLQALDPESGELIWERREQGASSSWSTPVVWKHGTETNLLVYEPFHLRCISVEDGKDVWSVPGLADEPITMPSVSDGLIVATSYNMRINQDVIGVPSFEELLAQCDSNNDGEIDIEESKSNKSVLSRPDADGQGDHPLSMFFRRLDRNGDRQLNAEEFLGLQTWVDTFKHANGFIALKPAGDREVPELAWQHATGVPECPSPIMIGRKLFAIRNGGVLTVLDVVTGRVLFQERIASGGPYYASPVSGDHKLFLASQRGHLTVLSLDGQPSVLATVDLGESIHATPALASGCLVVRSENQLWLFSSQAIKK